MREENYVHITSITFQTRRMSLINPAVKGHVYAAADT